MSKETLTWLNQNTLIGFTEKRGHAWHYRKAEQGEQSNHYPLAIPVADIHKRLFNWEPVYGPVPNPVTGEADEGYKSVCRGDTGKVLGVFKPGYEAHPYGEWLVNKVETVIDDGLQPASAGLLKSGGVAWVQVELPDGLTTPNGVETRPFLTATTSLDGTVATTYITGSNLVVCDNTLTGALASAALKLKFKHTKYSQGKATEIRDALDIVFDSGTDMATFIDSLVDTPVSDAQWERFVDAHTPLPDESGRGQTMAESKRDDLRSLYLHDDRVSPWNGTAFGVFQAVNTYDQHVRSTRGDTVRYERNMLDLVKGNTAKEEKNVINLMTDIGILVAN